LIKILNYFISQFLDLQSLKPPLEWNYLHQKGTIMSIQRIQPSKRFSEVVIHNNTAYFSGQVPEKTVKQNAYEQTNEVLSLIDKLLAEIGSEKSKILATQIFLADMTDYAQLNQAWDEWVDSQNPPSRATVEAKLADPDWKVEIVIIAAV
jgi:rutC family protein HI_1627